MTYCLGVGRALAGIALALQVLTGIKALGSADAAVCGRLISFGGSGAGGVRMATLDTVATDHTLAAA